jgi:hypothetical protein
MNNKDESRGGEGLSDGADHGGELHFIPAEVEDHILSLFVGSLAMKEFGYTERGRREARQGQRERQRDHKRREAGGAHALALEQSPHLIWILL